MLIGSRVVQGRLSGVVSGQENLGLSQEDALIRNKWTRKTNVQASSLMYNDTTCSACEWTDKLL